MNTKCCGSVVDVEAETMLGSEIKKLTDATDKLDNLINRFDIKISTNLTSENPSIERGADKEPNILTVRANSIRSIRLKIDKLNDTLESIIGRYQG